jgi:ankyrin repeat protein
MLLLERNVQVNAVDDQGQTPLHVAAIWGQAAMVQFLLDHGADISLKTKDGETALDVADKSPSGNVAAEVLRRHKGQK